MNRIPITEYALVLRSDFSDEAGWNAICVAIDKPVGDFKANMEFVSDLEYSGVTAESILPRIPANYPHSFICIVDGVALSHPEVPILVVDLVDEPGRTFRAPPPEMWGIENNLSISNMFFSEFADSVDADGIFRGFPRN